MASAQLKSAVLLAGLAAPGETTVIEAEATRDHTERMLKHFGAEDHEQAARRARPPHHRCKASPSSSRRNVVVPADPSSAAFPLVAALIVPGSEFVLEAVMTNPLRTGLLTTLARDGRQHRGPGNARRRRRGGRRSARAHLARLRASRCRPERAPSMIDEYPILAVAASFAEGTTRMRGLKELRVKESDRLAATADMLRVNGVVVEIEGDDMIVQGKGRPAGGGEVKTHMDHRIAMAALMMGLATENQVAYRRQRVHRDQLSGFRRADAFARRGSRMIIAIDGPAASGKGTLGKRLAAHYGLRHLDTGLIYRAVAKAVLDKGQKSGRCGGRRPPLRGRSILRHFDEVALKAHAISEAASIVSAIRSVREALLAFQREFAARSPGAVLDGRDIGTVICPDADVKIFVTATPEVRASRRAAEYKAQGRAVRRGRSARRHPKQGPPRPKP